MDPLSMSTSILTVLDVTLRVIAICQDYRAAVKGADWELPRIIKKVESLRDVLQALERLGKQAENADPATVSRLPQLMHFCDPEAGALALCLSEIQNWNRNSLHHAGAERVGLNGEN